MEVSIPARILHNKIAYIIYPLSRNWYYLGTKIVFHN